MQDVQGGKPGFTGIKARGNIKVTQNTSKALHRGYKSQLRVFPMSEDKRLEQGAAYQPLWKYTYIKCEIGACTWYQHRHHNISPEMGSELLPYYKLHEVTNKSKST